MDYLELEHNQFEAGRFPNELEAAYVASRAAWNRIDDGLKIAKARSNGKYVVVEEWTEYCPHTDAILGNNVALLLVVDPTDKDTIEAFEGYYDDNYCRRLLAPYDTKPVNFSPLTDDEIPF